MVKYVKCPRCELNYIDEEKQEYCDVCFAEMHGEKLQFADIEDDEFDELDGEFDQGEICPICGINPVRYGEKMCDSCKMETSEYERDDEIDIDKDEVWKNYLDEDTGDLTVDDETLQEELNSEFENDESESEFEGDDFFNEDIDNLGDDDDDDDEDDDDEDDDF